LSPDQSEVEAPLPQSAFADLRAHVLAHSVKRGDFVLKSGRRSSWFIDSKQTVCRPEAMLLVADAVLSVIPADATAIGGLTMGADPVAFVVAGLVGVLVKEGRIVLDQPAGWPAADGGRACNESGVKILGPATALMARRADHFRAHLLIEAAARVPLQRFLARWLPLVEALPGPAGLRWSIDVDPLEVD